MTYLWIPLIDFIPANEENQVKENKKNEREKKLT